MSYDASASDSRHRPLRPLLPATALPKRDDLPLQLTRRRYTPAACGACRARKIRCDGRRPQCQACLARGSTCAYATAVAGETHGRALKRKYADLREQQSTFEQVYEALQTRSQSEADEVYSRIRRGTSPESILRHIKEGDLLLQLALRPETRYRYEFPFIKEMPAFLQSADNAYLNSLVYEWTRIDAQAHQVSAGGAGENETPYLRPYHAAELWDARIDAIKPSHWTTVSTDDTLMRKLLTAYFLYGSQFFICFQKDYFLEDMASNRRRFCSSLLVNAVLAVGYSKSCYQRATKRYEHWNPRHLGYQFLAEAKRLWELEIGRSRLTTIHAGLVITLMHNMSCMDKVGWTYTLQAITIAHNLRLFDSSMRVKNSKERRARDFTAWALFNYQCLHCYVMFDETVIKNPPNITLPDPSVDPDWYGQIWVKYPLSPRPVSTHFEHLFKACADIRIIMNDICLQCFRKPASSRKVTLEQALQFRTRLKNWQKDLPGPLTPERIVYPSHFILHMNYQTVLLNLHEPSQADDSFDHGHIARAFAGEANAHLETLIRLYFLRHGFESFDPFLIHPLNVLGFSTINKINANPASLDINTTRSTIVLAAKGMYDQGQCHYIGQVTLRFIKSSMRPEETQLLGRFAASGDIDEDEIPERHMHEIQARWAPSIIRVMDDPEAQRLSNLVQQYIDMHLDSETDQTSDSSP
ncbi:hypothetical protein QQS21_002452 [Conoideocrella luteorostrata]|uniref:Zn(2)-C6 fungal-type domain-containing protein n=1 Tax=Conoideocrella luteorostrata TaxID=1105319 RepID=A0AAJ0FWI7_9HYPO|nr:hypothetical protein QQS21_002452 [Conoideocrella luteorostrata]